jgi:hypothetical protein
VQSGNYTIALDVNAKALNATQLANANANSVSSVYVPPITDDDDSGGDDGVDDYLEDEDVLTAGEVSGIIIGILAFLGLLLYASFIYRRSLQAAVKEPFIPRGSTTNRDNTVYSDNL